MTDNQLPNFGKPPMASMPATSAPLTSPVSSGVASAPSFTPNAYKPPVYNPPVYNPPTGFSSPFQAVQGAVQPATQPATQAAVQPARPMQPIQPMQPTRPVYSPPPMPVRPPTPVSVPAFASQVPPKVNVYSPPPMPVRPPTPAPTFTPNAYRPPMPAMPAMPSTPAPVMSAAPVVSAPTQSSNSSNTSTANEDIESQNIFELLGVRDGGDKEREEFLDELQQVIWEDFLEKDLELLLTNSEYQKAKEILAKPESSSEQKQDELITFLDSIIPDMEDIMLEKAIELKESMYKERIAGLKEYYAGKTDKLAVVDQAEKMMQDRLWASSTKLLNSLLN